MVIGALAPTLVPNFAALLFGRVVSGFGGGLLLVSILKLLTEAFTEVQHGVAFGVFVAGLPAGTGIAFDLFTPLSRWLGGWRGETYVAIVIALMALAAFAGVVRSGKRETRAANTAQSVLRNGPILRLSLAVVLGYTAVIGFTTWAPTTLVSYAHIPIWSASAIASILLLIDIPLGPLWGAVSDRIGRRKMFIILAFAIYLIGSIFIPVVAEASSWIVAPALLLVVAVMGSGCAMFFPVALSIPRKCVTHEQAGSAYGMFFTAQALGMLLGPSVIGYALDVTSATIAFLTVSAITFAGLLASIAIRSN